MTSLLRRLSFTIWYAFKKPPWDTGISPPELMAFLEAHPAGRALDLGCGTGTNVITIARRGWQVTGVDFAANAVRKARAKARKAGIDARFLVDDVSALTGVSQPHDLVLDIGCFHALPEASRGGYRTNIDRLLAPGGTYLLYVFIGRGDGPAISEEELSRFEDFLTLVERVDGHDRGDRRSAWITYRKNK